MFCITSNALLHSPPSTYLLNQLAKLFVNNIVIACSQTFLSTYPAGACSQTVPVLTKGLYAPQDETHVGHESSETQYNVQVRTRHLYQPEIESKIIHFHLAVLCAESGFTIIFNLCKRTQSSVDTNVSLLLRANRYKEYCSLLEGAHSNRTFNTLSVILMQRNLLIAELVLSRTHFNSPQGTQSLVHI